ncbi:FecR domain-containing protein [Pedobacter sp. HDW13]|nr:FecR domain-containing protein [Pedobacter sp. HDW13]QIL40550.1 FecR domain-containing protein [Pedobacter sp. HDW13]
MKNNPFDIADLIVKKFRGNLTEEESTALSNWRDDDLRNKLFLEDLEKKSAQGIDTSVFNQFDTARGWESVLKKQQRGTTVFMWRSIAAVLAVLISITIYFLVYQFNDGTERIVESKDAKYKNDVLPAILGAKVIRADGSEIKVEDNILFSADGHMNNSSTEAIGSEAQLLTKLNTLVVPAANYINLTLADGTKVWVNANSRLNFPSKFVGNERRVTLLEGKLILKWPKMLIGHFM